MRFVNELKNVLICFMVFLCFFCVSLLGQTGTTQAERPSNYYEDSAGTELNPYLISNLANLRWLSECSVDWWVDSDTRVHFMQTANIDATETAVWNYGEGFRPIAHVTKYGYNQRIDFIGVYDGMNYVVNNLTIRHYRYIYYHPWDFFNLKAMFVGVSNSIIKNVHLVNVSISSIYGIEPNEEVAGLAVLSSNTIIKNSSVSGNIIGSRYVGGITASIGRSSTIENSFSNVNLTLLNYQESITRSYVGGISAQVYGTIKNSFSISNIVITHPSGAVGGLSGMSRNEGVHENSYAVTRLLGDFEYKGGISGYSFFDNNTAIIDNSVWNSEISEVSNAIGELDNVEINRLGLDTHSMKQRETYTALGWDFDNIWDINPNINGGYPYLRNMPLNVLNEDDETVIRVKDKLIGNYPNPFNPTTTIAFDIAKDTNVRIDIYNIRGQKVKTLVNENYPVGSYKVDWHGTDDNNRKLASGVYFYHMQTDDYSSTRRMILMK